MADLERMSLTGEKFTMPVFRPIPVGNSEEGESCPSTEMMLDGLWEINLSCPDNFQGEVLAGGKGRAMKVPGQMENQGFTISDKDKVLLSTEFEIPDHFAGKRIFIRFDAVHGGSTFWLNGQPIGSSECYWVPVEFELASLAKVGQKNRLEVTLTRNCFAESIQFHGYTEQGHPHETGIPRSVRVFALPELHISRMVVNTDFDEHYKDATLELQVQVDSPRATTHDVSLDVFLETPDDPSLRIATEHYPLSHLEAGVNTRAFSLKIKKPRHWNAESPYLYSLKVVLSQGDVVLEQIEQAVGFREIEVRSRELLVNGKPVLLAGICHHEIDPYTQRSGTARWAVSDVLLMKAANINFVRTTHYPPPREFLDACDRYGIYACVEAGFMWTRFVPGEDDPDYADYFLDPTAAMVEYHRNNTSVIMWSLGNECGFEPNFSRFKEQGDSESPQGFDYAATLRMLQANKAGESNPSVAAKKTHENRLPINFTSTLALIRRYDPSRVSIFENEWNVDGYACDLGCLHYPPMPFDDSVYLQDDTRPVLIDEAFILPGWNREQITHDPGLWEEYGMGHNCNYFIHNQVMTPPQQKWLEENKISTHGQNHPESQWNHVANSKRIIGVAIWEFSGQHGLVDEWRRPRPVWWIVKRMFSPVQIPVRQIDCTPGEEFLEIPVENRYSFMNLNELEFNWEFAGHGGKCDLSLSPGAKGTLQVPAPKTFGPGQMLVIRVLDAQGMLVNGHGVIVGQSPTRELPQPNAGCPAYEDQEKFITISGHGFSFKLNKTDGRIETSAGNESLALKRFPTFYLVTGGGWSLQMPHGVPHSELPDLDSGIMEPVVCRQVPGALEITVKNRYRKLDGATSMMIDRASTCLVRFDYTYKGENLKVREVGVKFQLDPSCQQFSWRRRSEWDIYPDDHIGRPEGQAFVTRRDALQREFAHNDSDSAQGLIEPKLPQVLDPNEQPSLHSPTDHSGVSTARLINTKLPQWPWSLDELEGGTNDFKATKFNILDAELRGPDQRRLRVFTQGDVHVRTCSTTHGTLLHVWQARHPRELPNGSRLSGCFTVSLARLGVTK